MGNQRIIIIIFYRCSSGCTIETGYGCYDLEPSDCYEVCGDGLNVGINECDDGNTISGDG
jgi:hypothetical protein